jgi:hypothetical protein
MYSSLLHFGRAHVVVNQATVYLLRRDLDMCSIRGLASSLFLVLGAAVLGDSRLVKHLITLVQTYNAAPPNSFSVL